MAGVRHPVHRAAQALRQLLAHGRRHCIVVGADDMMQDRRHGVNRGLIDLRPIGVGIHVKAIQRGQSRDPPRKARHQHDAAQPLRAGLTGEMQCADGAQAVCHQDGVFIRLPDGLAHRGLPAVEVRVAAVRHPQAGGLDPPFPQLRFQPGEPVLLGRSVETVDDEDSPGIPLRHDDSSSLTNQDTPAPRDSRTSGPPLDRASPAH